MNVAVVAGRITTSPHRIELPNGEVRWSFDVSSETAEGRLAAVPVVCIGDESGACSFGVFIIDDLVVVSGVVRRRFFRVGGATQSRTEVVADHIVSQRSCRQVKVLLDQATEQLGRAAASAVSSSEQRAGTGAQVGHQREQES